MAHVSHRLKGAFEGALAGGADPATSPLHVFGPFLRLLVASGAGAVAFGTPIWMVVPARTLVEKAKDDPADLVIVASHGTGGRARAAHVPLGSVPERLFWELDCSMLVIPVADGDAHPAEVAA